MRNYFTFDGMDSRDFGVYISGAGTFNAPARRYESFTVPGRNGALTIDEGAFEEATVEYNAFIASNFKTNMSDFRNALLSRAGYVRMTDSYHPDEFYRARFMDGIEVEMLPTLVAGEMTLTFTRDPRRFLTSGETQATVASGGSITNPTLFDSNPLIRVTGYGTLTINSDVIIIASGQTYVDIDSETQNCFTGTTNKNDKVTFQSNKFPVLKPGANGISYSGNITKVEITPRWYRI